ncbi:MAG: hypothetical protein JL56_02865 [Desulfotomaculum sp. BICA1-6]|nr:MAG: hypothetical protein JL56_02865 [Desulfotomaculum sp. BICA1-6]
MYDAGPVTTKLKPRKRPERKVVILENLDFAWKPSDMTRAAEMWQEGMPVPDMARELKRHDDEVLLLIVHLGRLGRIQARPGGILG